MLVVFMAFAVLSYLLIAENTGGSPITFNESGVTIGGVPANVGQVAVFSVPLETSQEGKITLVRLKLLPMPGFPLPKLKHVALLGAGNTYPGSAVGWPPSTNEGGIQFPTVSFRGAVIDPHTPYHQLAPTVLYGVVGDHNHRLYATSGVRLIYKIGNREYSAKIFSGGMDCVVKFTQFASKLQQKWCSSQYSLAEDAQSSMIDVMNYVKNVFRSSEASPSG